MSRQRFSSGARFRWHETTYQVVRLLPGGQASIEEILTGVTSVVETSALVHALFADELQFVSEDGHPLPERAVDEAPLSLSDYPEALVEVARYRLEVIHPLLGMERRTRAAVLARVQEIKAAQPECGEHNLHESRQRCSHLSLDRRVCEQRPGSSCFDPGRARTRGQADQTSAQRGRGAAGAGHPGQVQGA